MLGKSINQHTKSKIFTDLATAKHYQAKYGGDVTEMKQYQDTTAQTINQLDHGIDNPIYFMIIFQQVRRYIFLLKQYQ